MKFDFFYYHVKNKNGDVIASYFEEDFTEDLVPDGCSYEIKYYEGCPAHCY